MSKKFNLSELIIVVIVLSILALIVMLNINDLRGKAEESAMDTTERVLETVLINYDELHPGGYPTLKVPTGSEFEEIVYEQLHPKYIKKIPKYTCFTDSERNVDCRNDSGESTPPTSGFIIPVKSKSCDEVTPAGYTCIYNDQDLNDVRKNLTGKYILMNDIDLSTSIYNTDADGWESIAGETSDFTGTFEGNGYLIKNLKINKPTVEYVGLFGSTDNAVIQNLGLVDLFVEGSRQVGGLTGYSYHSEIYNSFVSNGTVNGIRRTGGLIGYAINETKVDSSYSTGEILAREQGYEIGGLIGEIKGTVSDSYSIANITTEKTYNGGSSVGGLIGTLTGSVHNSYAKGNITAGDYVGGLVGNLSSGSVTKSFATGSIVTKYGYVGGLVGEAYDGIISNSYATGNVTSTDAYVGGLVGNLYGGTITETYSTGNVTINAQNNLEENYAGGFIGGLIGGEIKNSYSLGNVKVISNQKVSLVGGFAGDLYYRDVNNISNSYAAGSIDIEAPEQELIGGFVGNSLPQFISDVYYNNESGYLGLGTPKTVNELKKKETYSGWDFNAVWDFEEGTGYPVLKQ